MKSQILRLTNLVRFSYPTKSGRIFWGIGALNSVRLTHDLEMKPAPEFKNDPEHEFGAAIAFGKTVALGGKPRLNVETRFQFQKRGPLGASYLFFGGYCMGLNLQFMLN